MTVLYISGTGNQLARSTGDTSAKVKVVLISLYVWLHTKCIQEYGGIGPTASNSDNRIKKTPLKNEDNYYMKGAFRMLGIGVKKFGRMEK